MTVRAALYLRQSLDRGDDQLGIDRQRERSRALAAARDWSVVREYVDNDVSASKVRGPKTGWAQMLRDASRHDFEVVVAVDVDRLLRNVADLTTLIELGVRVVTVDGEIDLTTADGEFRATMLTAIARFEVRRKGERQRRANTQRRMAGIPAGGRAPFGYQWVPTSRRSSGASAPYVAVPSEAKPLGEAYRQVAQGVSLGTIVREWRAAGLRTPKTRRHPNGAEWSPTSLRRVLLSPFYAALIPEPSPEPYEAAKVDPARCLPGAWEPLVDRDTWMAVRELLLHPGRRTTAGTARRWLLAGIARCSVCDSAVISGGRGRGVAVYRCPNNHFSRLAVPLDAFVQRLVVARLSQPDAIALLAEEEDPGRAADLQERAILEQRLRSIVDLVADGTLDGVEARARAQELRGRIVRLDERIGPPRTTTVRELVEGDPQAIWNRYNLDQRRAVVQALLTLRLRPLGRGRGGDRQPISASTTVRWKEEAQGVAA